MTSRRIPRNWWGIAAALAAVVALAGWIWATTGIFRPEGFGEDPRAGTATAYALTSIAAALAVVLGGVGLAQRSRAKGLAGIGFGAGVVTLVAAVPVWLPVL